MKLKNTETYLLKEKIDSFINTKEKKVLYFDFEQVPSININYKKK